MKYIFSATTFLSALYLKAYVTFLFQGALFITLGESLKFAATSVAITED